MKQNLNTPSTPKQLEEIREKEEHIQNLNKLITAANDLQKATLDPNSIFNEKTPNSDPNRLSLNRLMKILTKKEKRYASADIGQFNSQPINADTIDRLMAENNRIGQTDNTVGAAMGARNEQLQKLKEHVTGINTTMAEMRSCEAKIVAGNKAVENRYAQLKDKLSEQTLDTIKFINDPNNTRRMAQMLTELQEREKEAHAIVANKGNTATQAEKDAAAQATRNLDEMLGVFERVRQVRDNMSISNKIREMYKKRSITLPKNVPEEFCQRQNGVIKLNPESLSEKTRTYACKGAPSGKFFSEDPMKCKDKNGKEVTLRFTREELDQVAKQLGAKDKGGSWEFGDKYDEAKRMLLELQQKREAGLLQEKIHSPTAAATGAPSVTTSAGTTPGGASVTTSIAQANGTPITPTQKTNTPGLGSP